MNFAGRWVPMEVMGTIFLPWIIVVLILAFLLFWPRRSVRPKSDRTQLVSANRKKRRGHRKR